MKEAGGDEDPAIRGIENEACLADFEDFPFITRQQNRFSDTAIPPHVLGPDGVGDHPPGSQPESEACPGQEDTQYDRHDFGEKMHVQADVFDSDNNRTDHDRDKGDSGKDRCLGGTDLHFGIDDHGLDNVADEHPGQHDEQPRQNLGEETDKGFQPSRKNIPTEEIGAGRREKSEHRPENDPTDNVGGGLFERFVPEVMFLQYFSDQGVAGLDKLSCGLLEEMGDSPSQQEQQEGPQKLWEVFQKVVGNILEGVVEGAAPVEGIFCSFVHDTRALK